MIITMPVPPSANNLFANNARAGRLKTKKYRQWIKDAGWCLNGKRPIAGPVKITIVCPHNGQRDQDNHIKPTYDLLVKHKLIDSDRCNCIREGHQYWAAKDSEQSRARLLTVEVVAA